MNNEDFGQEHNTLDELQGSLRQAVIELRGVAIPADALPRVIDRAVKLPQQPSSLLRRRRWLRASAVLAVAAAVLIAAAAWLLVPHDTWAQVAKTVQAKPWIHSVAKTPDGKRLEAWISFPRDVSGELFADGSAIFDDGKTKVRYEFQPGDGKDQQGVLTRQPLPQVVTKDASAFQNMFLGAMRGDKTLNLSSIFGAEILSQERRTVVENDKTWIDYDFILRVVVRDETIRIVFRVDPTTNLPASMKVSSLAVDPASAKLAGPSGRTTPTIEIAFDYPADDEGPRDIYDLRVPRTVKLVDRMPSTELADVISGIRASQDKFRSYFAVTVVTADESEVWQMPYVNLIWRNGKKWRVESAFTKGAKLPEKPEPNADMIAWWKKRVRDFDVVVPQLVSDGKTVWQVAREDGKPPMEKLWALSENDDGSPTNIARVHNLMPDLAGYHQNVPDSGRNVDARLLPAPPDSPPNCLLAEVRYTDPKSQQVSSMTRMWFDPAHSYLLRRSEWFNLVADRNQQSPSSAYSIDSIAQAPSGVWYPTRVREKFGDGDKLTWYFVDFNAKLPDSLFKPEPRTGDIE
jgi:hypothetical protein